jgi:hexosaminidase
MIAAVLLAALPSIVPWPRMVRFENTAGWTRPPRLVTHLYIHRDRQLGDEGYALSVGSRGAVAWANTHAGLFYANQTYAQLVASPGSHAVEIRDWPVYRWRGVHLDAARHFFDVATVERYIDVAARYKLNVFHWHLTDDQAWRLPIPGYPALTLRAYSYSDAQIREIVRYAAQRYVTVVPEIESAAHAAAALAAYPQFGCGSSDVFCPTSATFTFLQDVLKHTFALFPGPYVHVGGDEVPPGFDDAALIAHLEPYARAHGRQVVGWSEILRPQLSTSAIVMAWDSMGRAAAAASRGNRTVITGWPLYFDAAQGDPAQEPRATRHVSTLAEVYAWDVTPSGLSQLAKANVLGGEGALWTERIRTPAHLFYMLLPRELALAELLWTPRSAKSWQSFMQRLPAQFDWLDSRGYAFRIPNAAIDVRGAVFTQIPGELQNLNAWTNASRVNVTLSAPIGGVIRYTIDGSAPNAASRSFVRPLVFDLAPGRSVDVRAVVYFRGRRGAVTECRIHGAGSAALPRTGIARSWEALVSP